MATDASTELCVVCNGSGYLLRENCPLCDGAGEFSAESNDVASDTAIVGEVDVCFLSGHTVKVPVRAGQLMDSVKMEAFSGRYIARGMRAQLVHDSGVITGKEDATQFIGRPITALITHSDLSEQARSLLLRCTCRSPDDGPIGLLEIRFRLSMEDIGSLVELLAQAQPRRLLLGGAVSSANATLYTNHVSIVPLLVKKVEMDLQLEELEIPANASVLADIAKLLRRCPSLQTCTLAGDELNRHDVLGIRQEFGANIVI